MATKMQDELDRELERFNDEMVGKLNLTPTWKYYPELVGKQPNPKYNAYLWKKALLEHVIARAGELVDLNRGGERRSFEVVNPALRHVHGTTHTIGAALQLVKPGEIAPPHRHLASAIRFIVRGRGSYTAVEGERLYMEPRDFILTPTWMWHEHGNETKEPIVWVDALDYPFNKLMGISFFESGEGSNGPKPKPTGFTENWVGLARPAWTKYPEEIPMVTYKWTDTWRTLDRMRHDECSPHDGVILEYMHPFNQGPVLPTMACYAQLLRGKEHTKAHRHTSSTVYYVLDGAGHSVMDGERFDWAEGDFFMVPPWAWHEHANGTGSDATFFVMSDKPILDSFKLYREEPHADGHQRVTGTFKPIALS